MTPVRVGLVGVGWWASSYHLPALIQNPDAQVVAVCDVDLQRARTVADRFGIATALGSHNELLDRDLDAVVVATPNDAHFEPARDALDRGVDVLVEKPMTIEPGDAWELVDRAQRSGARLHVGYPFLYTRHVAELRAALADDQITLATGLFATAMRAMLAMPENHREPGAGDVVPRGGDTYSNPRRGGGQALSQATHCVSLLLWLTGERPAEVVALTHEHDLAVDLVDVIGVRCADGALLSIASTGGIQAHEQRVEEYRIFGASTQAALDTARGELVIAGHRSRPLEASEIYPATEPTRRLVDAALGRTPVLATGDLGARTVEVLAAALRAAASGEAQAIAERVNARTGGQ